MKQLALILAFVIVLSSSAYAQDFDWTTTQDFIDGARSFSSGNWEIETVTDNGRNTANEICLANMLGDMFNYADADGLTWKWADETTLSTEVTPYTRNIDTTVNDVYYIQVAPTTSGQYGGRYTKSNVNFTGTFDIRINLDRGSSASGNNQAQFRFHLDSTHYAYIYLRKPSSGYMTIVAGTQDGATAYSNTTTLSGGDDNAVSFRIARTSGDTITIYYDLAGGDTWNQHLQTTNWVADSGYAVIGVYRGVVTGTGTSHWYNYKEITLTTLANAFRTAGNWESDIYAVPADKMLYNLTIDHNGLSASNYISKVEILQGGDIAYSNDTDITSGSSTTFTGEGVYNVTTGDMTVKLYLAGNGAGSPIVTRVYGYITDYDSGAPSSDDATYFEIALNWTDETGIDTVLVESNYSGVATNYSMSQTFGGGWYNYLVNISNVSSGTYYWKSYANDTLNRWANTTEYLFTIQGSGGTTDSEYAGIPILISIIAFVFFLVSTVQNSLLMKKLTFFVGFIMVILCFGSLINVLTEYSETEVLTYLNPFYTATLWLFIFLVAISVLESFIDPLRAVHDKKTR